jgi:hypothetical protein
VTFNGLVKISKMLDVAVRLVDVAASVIEVYVRCDESSFPVDKIGYLGEFFILISSDILEYALGYNDVEGPVVELDR